MASILQNLKELLIKLMEFCMKYRKKIVKVIGISFLTIVIIMGGIAGFIYSKATSNLNYSQDQLQQIALGKVPGEVVDVEKELDFRHADFIYEFKIKDKDNMLHEVSVDSKYGTLAGFNNERHSKDNKFENGKHNKENKIETGKHNIKPRD